MKKFFEEFKTFAMRGNVIDLAVGVIIGGAFSTITSTLVNNVLMPLIGLLCGNVDLSKLDITLSEAVMDGDTVVKEAVVLGIGAFLSAIINFIIIAFCVFLLVKGINALTKKKEEAPAAPPAPPEPSKEEILLGEIRDLLKNK